MSDEAARTLAGRFAPNPMMMRFPELLLAACACAVLAAPAAYAQPADRLDSPDCKAAREQLEATLDDAGIGRNERAQRLAVVRKKVLEICLGPASAHPQRSGAPQPVLAVPAPIISAPPLYPTVRTTPPPLPAVSVPRPSVITTCDPGGCWDSDGRRLNNLGPMLVGPRGPCTLQGGTANCP
jgi:hypothetical protein